MDIKITFLNENMTENMYMTQPENFINTKHAQPVPPPDIFRKNMNPFLLNLTCSLKSREESTSQKSSHWVSNNDVVNIKKVKNIGLY
jgi:hypothetical protein